jgi:hypothetical protein
MYVRKKQVRKGIGTWDKPWKVYDYWQVVRSTRVAGQPRQKVVAYVGAAKDRDQADTIARAKGLLCGVKGCGEAASIELASRTGHVTTYRLKDPDGGETREYGYLVCPDHSEDYQRNKRYPTVPLLLRD